MLKKIFLFALLTINLASYAKASNTDSSLQLTNSAPSQTQTINPIALAKQLIVVTAKNWDSTTGILQRYERSSTDSPWQKFGELINVNLGKNGMGWGKGLHGKDPLTEGPVVIEGAKRAPVGAFDIPFAFGRDAPEIWQVKLPYIQISDTMFAPDDPKSQYYNQVVDTKKVTKDWDSAEDMQGYVNEGSYIYGAMIGHNLNPVINQGDGSNFFIHIWHAGRPTCGCTAMEANNAKEVISWLDPLEMPVLVQLPETIYAEFENKWTLPSPPVSNHDEL